jgi:hypothetical protein
VDQKAQLRETLELQDAGFRGIGGQACPFYERLASEFLRDIERGGPVWKWLEPHADAPFDQAYALRLMGAMHRLALTGDDEHFVAHFPSTGGDGDATATYAHLAELLVDPPPLMADMMTRPPQTNEVGRSIALASGLLVIADTLRMPIALREIGSSAGLNLRLDN